MEPVENLLQDLEQKKRKWKRISLLTTIIPVVLILGFMWYARHEIKELEAQETSLETKIDSLRSKMMTNRKYLQDRAYITDSAEALLKREAIKGTLTPEKIDLIFKDLLEDDSTARHFSEVMLKVDSHRVSIRLTGDLTIKRPEAKQILFLLFQLQGVKWKTGGTNPDEGFDDKGLIDYTLQEVHATADEERTTLDKLEDGDIVILESGYSMFYFKVNGAPFYLGITERGICPVSPSFGKIVKYRKTTFHE